MDGMMPDSEESSDNLLTLTLAPNAIMVLDHDLSMSPAEHAFYARLEAGQTEQYAALLDENEVERYLALLEEHDDATSATYPSLC